jgi:hypothetical protein
LIVYDETCSGGDGDSIADFGGEVVLEGALLVLVALFVELLEEEGVDNAEGRGIGSIVERVPSA